MRTLISKKSLSIFVGIILIAILQSCQPTIQIDNNIESIAFTDRDLKNIQKFVLTFDDILYSKYDTKDPVIAYGKFLDEQLESMQNANYTVGIPQDAHDALMQSLSGIENGKIWSDYKVEYNRKLRDNSTGTFPDSITLKNVKLNTSFSKYVEEKAKEYPVVQKYWDIVQETGFGSIRETSEMLVRYSNYDLQKLEIRLLFALKFTTMNDAQLKYEESYKKLVNGISNKFEERRMKEQ